MEMYLDQDLMSLELRGFGHVTKKTYMGHIRRFIMFTKKRPEECDYEDVRRFLHHAIKRRKISASYVNNAYSAIRYYYETTLCRDWNMRHVPRLKIRPPLPNVLTVDEVRRVLAATENLKQRAMLSTCYSSGLRVNELVHLKVKDIDSESMRLRVQYCKGGKSRNTIRDLTGHATMTATSRYLHMTKAVTLGLKSLMDRWEEEDD